MKKPERVTSFFIRTLKTSRYNPLRGHLNITVCKVQEPLKMSVPTRILAIDDHVLFRESLVHLLEREPDFQVVAQCNTVIEAAPVLSRNPVDLVLLAYELHHGTGADLLRDLMSRGQGVKVLVVTGGISEAITIEILAAGAAGVLPMRSNPPQLLDAIRRISQGEIWLDSGTLRAVIKAGVRNLAGKDAACKEPLTLRQHDVLSGILAGLSNGEIAEKLKLSTSAIKTTVQDLFEKAGVQRRTQLVRVTLEKHMSDWLARDRV